MLHSTLHALRSTPHALCSPLHALRASPHALRSSLLSNQGAALVLALVMVTIITGIIGMIMMAMRLQWCFIRDDQDRLQALYLAEAGVYKTLWLLSGNGGKHFWWRPENETIALLDEDVATVSVKEWGGYLQITSTANSQRMNKTVCAMVGEKLPALFRQAIVIGGVDYPLVVTGKNRIIGDVTVGPEGVKKGRIKGRDFEGKNLVEGKIFRQRQPQMPYFGAVLLRSAQQKYLRALENPTGQRLAGPLVLDGEARDRIQEENIHIDGDVQINFLDAGQKLHGPKFMSCSGNISIQGHTQITGDIEWVAGGKISVTDQVRMQNCILFAKAGMEVSGDCQITGQLLSNGNITLKQQATLNYPSVIYCNAALADGQIALQGAAIVRGTVIMDAAIKMGESNASMIHISPAAKVAGAIYSSRNTEHRGKVFGSIVTGQFFLYESPTIYLNWLQDAVIDRSQLPEGFLLPIGFGERPALEALTWEEKR